MSCSIVLEQEQQYKGKGTKKEKVTSPEEQDNAQG